MRKAILVIAILMVSITVALIPHGVLAATPAISRVQGPATNTSATNSVSVTLGSTPQVGDVIVVTLGVYVTGVGPPRVTPTVNAQTGITWIDAGGSADGGFSDFKDVVIFEGVVTSTPSSTISFSIGTTSGAIGKYSNTVVACEYSGLNTAFITSTAYDRHSSPLSGVSSSPSTGPTTSATRYPVELWVGATLLHNFAQSSPTGGFTCVNNGAVYNGISLAYLEQIASSTGTPQSTTTGAGTEAWAGYVVALPAAPTITLSSSSGNAGSTITITGDNYNPSSSISTATLGATSLTLASTAIDANGHFSTTFTVPAITVGSYKVTVTDAVPSSASTSFTILTPSITLSAYSGISGDVVTVTGSNYKASSTITITFNSVTQSTTPVTVTTDSSGHCSATITIPTIADGPYTCAATDLTYSASATFVVSSTPPPSGLPESPFGVIAPLAAIGLAFAAFGLVKRSKTSVKPSMSI